MNSSLYYSSHDTIPSKLVLFFFVAKVVDQSGDAIFQPAMPVGPCLGTQGFIPEIIYSTVTETDGGTPRTGREAFRSPLQEGLEAAAIGKASSPDPQVFHQAQILYLMSDQNFIKPAYTKMLCLLTIKSMKLQYTLLSLQFMAYIIDYRVQL